VVTVDHPDNAIREIITEETGFLTSLSADDLADKIRVALCRYPAMKPACMASVQAYDWDRIVDRAERYYQSLIN
jgi:glycosyltransferase involved in cell wall biosynthesis